MSDLDKKLADLKKTGSDNAVNISKSRSVGVAIGSLFFGGIIFGPFLSMIIFQILELVYGKVQNHITGDCGTYKHYNENGIDWWFNSNFDCDSYDITFLGFFALAPLSTYLTYIIIRTIGFKFKFFVTKTSLLNSKWFLTMMFYFITILIISLRPHGKVMSTSLDTLVILLFDIYLLIQIIGFNRIKDYINKSKIK